MMNLIQSAQYIVDEFLPQKGQVRGVSVYPFMQYADIEFVGGRISRVSGKFYVDLLNADASAFEIACREWAKGCSCADAGSPEDCAECTQAFLDRVKKLCGICAEVGPVGGSSVC